MKWARRLKEIEVIRARVGKDKGRTIPELSVEHRMAPCSNGFAKIVYSVKYISDAEVFPVGHGHKQGLELLTPATIANDLKWMGGLKP